MGNMPEHARAVLVGRSQSTGPARFCQSNLLPRKRRSFLRMHILVLDDAHITNNSAHCCAQIDVREASDIQAAFAFSKKTGVKLSVKNSGHDHKGRSSGVNTLALWVSITQSSLEFVTKLTLPDGNP